MRHTIQEQKYLYIEKHGEVPTILEMQRAQDDARVDTNLNALNLLKAYSSGKDATIIAMSKRIALLTDAMDKAHVLINEGTNDMKNPNLKDILGAGLILTEARLNDAVIA